MKLGITLQLNSRKKNVKESVLLLDDYPGAIAAYALVNLTKDWVGEDVVLIRRDSDNAELGFTAVEVSNGTLEAWVGAGNGYVKTWYDQSGNNNNLIQNTLLNQPIIVSSGALVISGTMPGINFNRTSNRLQTNLFSPAILQPVSVFSVAEEVSTNKTVLYDGFVNSFFVARNTADKLMLSSGTILLEPGTSSAERYLFSSLHNISSSYLYINSSTLLINGNSNSSTLDGISVGNLRGSGSPIVSGYEFKGNIQVIVFYDSDLSSNRTSIETVLNNIFLIY